MDPLSKTPLISGYNPFPGCGCSNYMSVQKFPKGYKGTFRGHLETSCSNPASGRVGCSGGIWVSPKVETPQPLWRTCGSPTSQQKLKEITPCLSKQPAPGEVSPAQLNLQHSLSLGQLQGELPALPLQPSPSRRTTGCPQGRSHLC